MKALKVILAIIAGYFLVKWIVWPIVSSVLGIAFFLAQVIVYLLVLAIIIFILRRFLFS